MHHGRVGYFVPANGDALQIIGTGRGSAEGAGAAQLPRTASGHWWDGSRTTKILTRARVKNTTPGSNAGGFSSANAILHEQRIEAT